MEQFALGRREAPQDPDLLVASAFSQQSAGRWDEALASLRQAQALDPRSAQAAMHLSYHLTLRRRYAEALEAADRGLALAPQSLNMLMTKVSALVAQGDLAGAQAAIRAAPREVAPTALVAHVAVYGDLFWVLDDEQQALLLRLTPGPFDEDRGSWGLALAQTAALRGDAASTRKYAEAARVALEAQLRDAPEEGYLQALHGLALAYLGRHAEAVREGEHALALAHDAQHGSGEQYVRQLLMRIYLRAGKTERALDLAEELLQAPSEISPGRLRIDPDFAPLRDHPRFRRLAGWS
jgi:tetratricopeptide (TPR) repeat protein